MLTAVGPRQQWWSKILSTKLTVNLRGPTDQQAQSQWFK